MKKILIQENSFFTSDMWKCTINHSFRDIHKYYVVKYIKTELEFKREIENTNICFSFALDRDFNYQNTKLELIYLGLSNLDYIDKYNLGNNILFCSTKGIASKMISEYVLMASMMLIKNINLTFNNYKKRKWNQASLIHQKKTLIQDYNIGVLGLGDNGKEIVNIFNKLGCKVSGCSISKKPNIDLYKWYSSPQFHDLIKNSDILIIALPLNHDTEFLISNQELIYLGSNSYIINISRGDIIVESDLINALNKNLIKGAAIDVCTNEPPGRWSRLWKTKNLILTPHISGNINSFVNEVQSDFISKVKSLLT
jgi:phosphoglycerate dehydrogenase-like enzyme